MAPEPVEADPLHAAILAAHDAGDKAALTKLYRQAADRLDGVEAQDQVCFFLTQAYIFALDSGSSEAEDLRQRLVSLGREN